MKKIISLLMVLLLVFQFNVFVVADSNETEPSDWAKEGVTYLKNNKVVQDELFQNYEQAITREEFATLIVKIIEFYTKEELKTDTNAFVDVNNEYINKAYKNKIVNGIGDNKFNPSGLITREQMAVMFINALKLTDLELLKGNNHIFSDNSEISWWAVNEVALAFENKIISGVGNNEFNPKGTATREQAMLIAYRVLNNALNSKVINYEFDNINPNLTGDTDEKIKDEKIKNEGNNKTKINNNDDVELSTSNNIKITALDKKAEYIILKNTGNTRVDLNGWKIVSVRGKQTFIFSSYIIEPGATVTVGDSAKNKVDLHWLEGKGVWSNTDPDPAELYDGKGNLVDKHQ